MSTETVKITGEFTPDPHVCKFIVDAPLLEEWTLMFKCPEDSLDSPLVDALFAVEGLTRVQVSGSVVTLTKDDSCDYPWPQLAKEIVPAIRQALESGQPLISEAAIEAVEQSGNADDLFGLIEQLFELHINPALASHGGFVKLVEVKDRSVLLEMGGGCQGCASSQATLRNGIEQAIREVAPQVREIVDVTDHASGTNPYYT